MDRKYFSFHNVATVITIVLTLLFFVLALFVKGFGHDLLLEAAVFLVSVKIILGMVQIDRHNKEIARKLDRLLDQVATRPRD